MTSPGASGFCRIKRITTFNWCLYIYAQSFLRSVGIPAQPSREWWGEMAVTILGQRTGCLEKAFHSQIPFGSSHKFLSNQQFLQLGCIAYSAARGKSHHLKWWTPRGQPTVEVRAVLVSYLPENNHNEGFQALKLEVRRFLNIPVGHSQTLVISCRNLIW